MGVRCCFIELNAMMAFTIGPGDPSVKFSDHVAFRNGKADDDGRALAENLVNGYGGPTKADVEQGGFHPFVAGFHANGRAGLFAIVALLLHVQSAYHGRVSLTIDLEFAQQSAAGMPNA